MRRKFGYWVTAAVMAFAFMALHSCSKYKVARPASISMGVSERVTTKAVVDDKASLVSQSINSGVGFGVFSYKKIAKPNETPVFFPQFNNTQVFPRTNSVNTTWYYSPTRYWDSENYISYQFVAYWPHVGTTSGNGPYVSEADRILTIHDIPCWQDGSLTASADFMTAERRGSYSNGDFTINDETMVRFTFSHILAKLVIKAYYIGVQENPVKINGIDLVSVDNRTLLQTDGTVATYSQPFGGQDNVTTAFSTVPKSTATHTLFDAGQSYLELPETTYDDDDNDPDDHGYQDVCNWLMVPCTGWQNLGLDVTYSVGESNSLTVPVTGLSLSTTLSSEAGDSTYTGQTFSGRAYVVTLKFDSSGGGITLQNVEVEDWVNHDIPANVYNW